MNKYVIGQTVYWVQYTGNFPFLRTFTVAAVRETLDGFFYSQYPDNSVPYMSEDQLFETGEDAIDYQITLLENLRA